jgi:hypothetical protein
VRWPLLLVVVVGLPAIVAELFSRSTTAASANTCTLAFVQQWYIDQAARAGLVVEPLADSVLVGEYFTLGPRGLTTERPFPNARGTLVFGQLARVMAAQGLDDGIGSDIREVVLIWWGVAPSCDRFPPGRALGAAPGEHLFIGLSPRRESEWIADAPTFDIDVPDDRVPGVYGPTRTRQPMPPVAAPKRQLTAQEFAAAVMQLPTTASVRLNREAARRSLLTWAERNPDLAQRYPIADFVAAAQAEESARR